MIGNCYNCPAAVCSVTVWDAVQICHKRAPNEIQESIYQVNYYLSGNFFYCH